MPKGGDNLTGGSRDVNPQWMNLNVVQPGTDLNVTQMFPLPVQRLQQKSGKSLVMEILKIGWDLPLIVPSASAITSVAAFLTTKDPSAQPIAGVSPVFFFDLRKAGTTLDYNNRVIIASSSSTPVVYEDDPIYHDMTDDAGHGILVATDNLFLSFFSIIGASSGTGLISNVLCRILYRWKEVTLQEYIGIVQSQQ